MEMESAGLVLRFVEWVGVRPTVYKAPGRVNLIGEHTDYNDGFVMPCAIGLSTRVATSRREDRRLMMRSGQFSGEFEFDLDHLPASGTGAWCDHVVGVALALKQNVHDLAGANLLVESEVPIGAGLSSSAAIEVACALALMELNEIALPRVEVARLCQHSENEFVGARVG